MHILSDILCAVVEIVKVLIVIYAGIGFVIFFIRRYS